MGCFLVFFAPSFVFYFSENVFYLSQCKVLVWLPYVLALLDLLFSGYVFSLGRKMKKDSLKIARVLFMLLGVVIGVASLFYVFVMIMSSGWCAG